MYYILEFDDGQPVILWQTGNNLQKYVINSGRIYNRGILKTDIIGDFHIWSMKQTYLSYKSVDGSTVVCHMTRDSLNEVYTTKNTTGIVRAENKLYVFFLVSKDDEYELYLTTSHDFSDKLLICKLSSCSEIIHVTKINEYIVLFLREQLIYISSDFKVARQIKLSSSKNVATVNLENEVSRLKFELHQLEQHHQDFICEYDRLYAYTGELQEKLRKTKLKING